MLNDAFSIFFNIRNQGQERKTTRKVGSTLVIKIIEWIGIFLVHGKYCKILVQWLKFHLSNKDIACSVNEFPFIEQEVYSAPPWKKIFSFIQWPSYAHSCPSHLSPHFKIWLFKGLTCNMLIIFFPSTWFCINNNLYQQCTCALDKQWQEHVISKTIYCYFIVSCMDRLVGKHYIQCSR